MFCRATPYEGKEPFIFVSYCHADKEQIYPLIEQMSLDGYRAWYDVGNKPGLNWLLNIEEHLENCKAVIAFISKHSRDSNNCNKEIVYAMKCDKKVIPVLIEDAMLPRGLRMQLADLHYLERKNFPSDKELLKKCYEADECKECKDPSGSIPLRADKSVRPSRIPGKNPFEEIIGNLQRININRNVKEKKEDPPIPEKKVERTPPKEEVIPDYRKTDYDDISCDAPVLPDEGGTYIEPTPSFDPLENTVIPGYVLTEEDTVYGGGLDDGTIINGRGFGFDDDQTVRISRNLAILLHPAEQKAYKLKSPKITVGRSQIRCDVAIDGNDSISKVHAFIRQTKQKCYIEDANSSNGTYVNGEQIEPGQQVPLDNPAIFQLNDETLILLSGSIARKFDKKSSIALLINEDATAVCIMDSDTLPLNRSNKWPDGTLSDPKIHRAAHALLNRCEDGVHLVDEGPEKGNGTHLNGSRMHHGDSKLLSSGDRIRLGDTTLEFISIEIPS